MEYIIESKPKIRNPNEIGLVKKSVQSGLVIMDLLKLVSAIGPNITPNITGAKEKLYFFKKYPIIPITNRIYKSLYLLFKRYDPITQRAITVGTKIYFGICVIFKNNLAPQN